MRSLVAVAVLLICLSSSFAQKGRSGPAGAKPNSSEYSLKIHISATRIRNECSQPGSSVTCNLEMYADALQNGKKLELFGKPITFRRNSLLLVPGDYPARLTKDLHNSDNSAVYQEYDLLLPDNTVWHSATTGISE